MVSVLDVLDSGDSDVVDSGGVVGDGRGGGDLDLLNLDGLNLDLLDLGHGQGVGVGQRGGGDDDGGDVADGVDETVLVDVLGEAFKGQGPESVLGGDEVTAEDGVDWPSHLSGGGSGGSGGQSNNSERLHVERRMSRSVKCVLLE